MNDYTLIQFLFSVGLFALGTLFGVGLMCVLAISKPSPTLEELAVIATNAQDSVLLDYLDKSECSMFFNPVLSAWGLIDGQHTLIATAHNVRNTLSRAIDKDKLEVATPVSPPDGGPAPVPSAVAKPIPAHIIERSTKGAQHVPL